MKKRQSLISRYPVYKSSEVDWLGSVPTHWEVKRIKEIGTIQYGLSQPPKYLEKGLPLIRATNIERGKIVEKGLVFISPDDVPYERNPILNENDILVVRSGAYTADSAIVTKKYHGAVAGFDMVLKPYKIQPKYLSYALLSDYVLKNQLILSSFRAAQPHLNKEELGMTLVVYPPLSEQQAIANYLDTKTAQIDRKIDLLTQKAEQYGNLKQSLINETVTHGFDRSVPIKDSGIEWLGEVPEHWEVIRLKDVADQSKEKNGTNPVGQMLSVSGYRGIEIKQYDDELKKRTDDELLDYRVVRVGQLVVNTMWLNYRGIGVSKYRGYVSPAYRAYFVNKSIHGAFIHYLMRSDLYVSGYSKYLQGIRPNSLQMKTIDFECLPLPIPPLSEQKSIADYLDTKTTQIDQIIQTLNTQIEKLKELRKTLINDVVTGKIKVV